MIRLLVAALATACAVKGDPELTLGSAEAAVSGYATAVHPILEARCATLDCHGDGGRALRLFAETGLRARDELRGAPITPDELLDDVRSLVAVDPGAAPAQSLVVTKPLAGGVDHVGRALWDSIDEPQAVCVVAWLDGRLGDPAATAACERALDEVALPPP